MNKMYNLMMKTLRWGAASALVCLALNLSAQQANPVGTEFYGQWTFTSAQAQERPLKSQDPYTTRIVSLEDFSTKIYFYDLPTEIAFMEDGMDYVVNNREGMRYMETRINPDNSDVLEFIEQVEMELDGIKEMVRVVSASYHNLTLNGNTMTMQYLYFYGTDQIDGTRTYTDGILTIQYKR